MRRRGVRLALLAATIGALAALAPGPSNAAAEAAACGGIAGLACGADQYCDYPEGSFCGAADRTGVCRPRPEACIMLHAPVCGCDGQTHSNACRAAAEGTDVAAEGMCRRDARER